MDEANDPLLQDGPSSTTPRDSLGLQPLNSPSIAQDLHPARSATHRRLYVSHLLSTLSSRLFEFASTLYLAHIFPGTLLPLSIYALCRGLAAVFLSPSIGRYIDSRPRLKVVRESILGQRVAVAVSCVILYAMAAGWIGEGIVKWIMLGPLSLLACVEKLCAVMNLVAVERDWVIVVAGDDAAVLRKLNSQMRRIDLFCKLMGPFAISVVDSYSTSLAVLVNLGMSLLVLPVEWWTIKWVHDATPALQRAKVMVGRAMATSEVDGTVATWKRSLLQNYTQLRSYFSHRAIGPSLAGALLYLTVLSFSGQMVTFLLAMGLSSFTIACLRTISVGFELSATWLAPMAMRRIGPVRAGIWFLSWQMGCLAGGGAMFWVLLNREGGEGKAAAAAIALVVGTILSRIGLWGFDLSSQIIVQEEVEIEERGSFSTVEAAMQSMFELWAFVATIIWSRPDQFKWPVLLSCGSVYAAGVLYASFVRSRRGHLVHFCDGDAVKRRRRRGDIES